MKIKGTWIHKTTSPVLLGILLLLTYFLYQPGLQGGLTYDDYHSLEKLAVFDGEVTTKKLIQYLGQSDTGILKRPISVYSFLLDAQDWPAAAYSFKRTNLIIHLINGVLMFMLILMLMNNKAETRAHRHAIAFSATALWLLHPFLVSTTLYVVQRMAMLPVTFLLMGLLAYVYCRLKWTTRSSTMNSSMLFVSVWGATLLATLSKENGVLVLPSMALFEFFIMRKYLKWPPLNQRITLLLFKVPIVLMVIGFVAMIPKFSAGYEVRDFSAYERLLTQGRVLVEYMYHLLVPKYFTPGVYADGLITSTGLLNPVSTLLSWMAVVGLLVVAWLLRHRWIWLSFSLFFFFIAHSLESTLIPLEMYYEHRNYMAALFLPVVVSLLIVKWLPKRHVHWTVMILIVGFVYAISTLRVQLWSNEFKLHEMTLEKYPESVRVYSATAQYYAASGYTIHAINILNQGIARHQELHLQLNKIYMYCQQEEITQKQYKNMFDELFMSFQTQPFLRGDRASFTALFRDLVQGQCQTGQDSIYAQQLFDALKTNPHKDRKYLKVMIQAYGMFYAIEQNQFEMASQNMKILIQEYGQYAEVMNGLRILLGKNQFQLANDLLHVLKADYEKRYRWKPDLNYYDEQIKSLFEWAEELESNS